MREGTITAIVPVRAGSQRVKNKSVRNFCDTNLLENKLNQLIKIKKIDSIILTTDSDEAKKIGRKYDKVTIQDRTGYYASSECNNSDFFRYIAQQSPENSKYLI